MAKTERTAGQNPDPNIKPDKDIENTQQNPDPNATPTQDVQTEKADPSINAKAAEKGEKWDGTKGKYRVRCIAGLYVHDGCIKGPDDGWFHTDIDLVGRFGTEKFEGETAGK